MNISEMNFTNAEDHFTKLHSSYPARPLPILSFEYNLVPKLWLCYYYLSIGITVLCIALAL
jgi:hypothetical protein